MRKLILTLIFIPSIHIYGLDEQIILPPFVIDSLSIVMENEETIAFRENYDDVMKKKIKPVQEYTEKIGKFESKVLDYGFFEVFFDSELKIDYLIIKNDGPRLLQADIRIGEDVEELISRLKKEPRYGIRKIDKVKKEIGINFNYSEAIIQNRTVNTI